MSKIIGIDLGTSAVKLLLMEESGKICNIVSREYPLFFPHPGWSEQKPEDWFMQSMEGMKELTKDDKAPELALGWRAKKLNGKYEFKWLYCGRFGQGFEDNYETEGETKTTQTATLKGDFYARQMDGRYECSVDESNLLTEHTEAAAAIKDWFSKVQEKPDAA